MKRRGLNRIDMEGIMVALAVIGLVAIVIVPARTHSREKAREGSCIGNLKQLALGYLMYAEDNDRIFPTDWVTAAGGRQWTDRYTWRAMIYPYVRNLGVYSCPGDSYSAYKGAALAGQCVNGEGSIPASYGDNFVHWGGPGPPYPGVGCRWCRVSQIAHPIECIIIGESSYGSHQIAYQPATLGYRRNTSTPDPGATAHHGAATYGFADGHVRWMTPSSIPDSASVSYWCISGRGDR